MQTENRYMIYNGELQPLQLPEGAFLYQNIHTLGYKPRHLKHHLDIITSSAGTLWGLEISLSENKIQKEIVQLLDHSRLSRNVSICVIIRLYATGDYSLHVGHVSIYSGYVLRSLRPVMQCIKMDVGMSNYPTSALKASYDLAYNMAVAQGYHEPIMINSAGYAIEDPLRPLAIIKDHTITIPPPTLCSVECMLLEEAAEKHGLTVNYGKISLGDIKSADEVLMMTFQGITSISQIENKIYFMSLAAKIATRLEEIDLKE